MTYKTTSTSCPLSPVKAIVSFLRHMLCIQMCLYQGDIHLKKRDCAELHLSFCLRLRENIVHLITYPFKLVFLHGVWCWRFFSSLRSNIKGNRDFSAFKEEKKKKYNFSNFWTYFSNHSNNVLRELGLPFQ